MHGAVAVGDRVEELLGRGHAPVVDVADQLPRPEVGLPGGRVFFDGRNGEAAFRVERGDALVELGNGRGVIDLQAAQAGSANSDTIGREKATYFFESVTGSSVVRGRPAPLGRSTVSFTSAAAGAWLNSRIRSFASNTAAPSTCVITSPSLNPVRAAGVPGTTAWTRAEAALPPFERGEVVRLDAQEPVFRLTALPQVFDRPLKGFVRGIRIACRVFVTGRHGDGRGEADQFAFPIHQRRRSCP